MDRLPKAKAEITEGFPPPIVCLSLTHQLLPDIHLPYSTFSLSHPCFSLCSCLTNLWVARAFLGVQEDTGKLFPQGLPLAGKPQGAVFSAPPQGNVVQVSGQEAALAPNSNDNQSDFKCVEFAAESCAYSGFEVRFHLLFGLQVALLAH